MLHKPFIAVSCLALFAAAGCVVVDDNDPPPSSYYGTLTTYWTLDGSDAPSVCSYYGVDRVDVAIYDANDNFVVDARPICEDFGISFDVADGAYFVDVTLLDFGGSPLSDTVSVDVDVYFNEVTILDVDFPDGSIY